MRSFLWGFIVGSSILWLCWGIAKADDLEKDLHVGGMLGVFGSQGVKRLNVGYDLGYSYLKPFILKLDGSYIHDDRYKTNHSLGLSAMIGPQVSNDVIFASITSGPGLVISPSPSLGGPFQFFHEATIGIKDRSTKAKLGVSCMHVSNAGIYPVNNGLDMCGVKFYLGF